MWEFPASFRLGRSRMNDVRMIRRRWIFHAYVRHTSYRSTVYRMVGVEVGCLVALSFGVDSPQIGIFTGSGKIPDAVMQ